MRQEKTQLQILPKRYCNRIRNGYEFISNDGNVMYILTRCVSMLGEQENIYYNMKVYVKEATEWLKTSGSRCLNVIPPLFHSASSILFPVSNISSDMQSPSVIL